jgi:hypothetical protein
MVSQGAPEDRCTPADLVQLELLKGVGLVGPRFKVPDSVSEVLRFRQIPEGTRCGPDRVR